MKTASHHHSSERRIQALVDRETPAWNSLDADALVGLFHPDAVWPWPPNPTAHDPAQWVLPMGRFNRERWTAFWEALFVTNMTPTLPSRENLLAYGLQPRFISNARNQKDNSS
jgi:hypothetical protein